MQKKNLQITKIISSHFDLKNTMMRYSGVINKLGEVVSKIVNNGGCVFWCGNGGSAADAQHLAAELVGRFERDRRAIKSIALNTDTSAITAIANDYSYETIFSRQIEGIGAKGDVLLVISTSGNSKNIVKAVRTAKKKELITVGLTGKNYSKVASEGDYCIAGPSKETSHIQELHIIILHLLCILIEKKI